MICIILPPLCIPNLAGDRHRVFNGRGEVGRSVGPSSRHRKGAQADSGRSQPTGINRKQPPYAGWGIGRDEREIDDIACARSDDRSLPIAESRYARESIATATSSWLVNLTSPVDLAIQKTSAAAIAVKKTTRAVRIERRQRCTSPALPHRRSTVAAEKIPGRPDIRCRNESPPSRPAPERRLLRIAVQAALLRGRSSQPVHAVPETTTGHWGAADHQGGGRFLHGWEGREGGREPGGGAGLEREGQESRLLRIGGQHLYQLRELPVLQEGGPPDCTFLIFVLILSLSP